MRRATLRARLIAAAAAATVGAVAVLGVTVLVLVDHQLHNSLDTTLRSGAAETARLAASTPALLTAPGALEAPFGGRQLSVEVVDGHGRIYARSPSLGGRILPGGPALTAALSSGRSSYRDARLSGESIREYVAPLADAGGPVAGGAVLVGSSTAEIEDTVRKIRALVLFSALAAGLLGAAGAALLTQRGLRPLRRLVDGARDIADTHDASRRLPIGRAGGELAELAQTLNRMLESLERARATERRFLADASHELRTPLTSLRGNAAYVARHGADAAALGDIEADVARLARLLDDLLALEREDGAVRPDELVHLSEVVDAVCADHPEVEVTIEEEAAVRGERGALERALGNLVENARIHGPPDTPIEVALSRRGATALLAVRDGGPGLDADQVELAFQRFWRGAGGGRPGSGLGLSIVAATAARHGGRVRVDGSRFTLELPAVRGFSEVRPRLVELPDQEGPP
ncbi:MAG: two-component system, OmpR family, sensor kinase [Solirubrobacteraceae bacterium]|jgi:signal transduction histidine kinase|nr:two-component system, OmpR family, sensor kinase [Solirubrobacteraceae bacterium]